MKCSAKLIVSRNDEPNKEPGAARLRKLASEFEALLLSVTLRPMTKSLGPMSEVVAQRIAMEVAPRMSNPIYDQLRHELE
jgi:hypothetical protein